MPDPHILIVEDEEDLAENLADLLKFDGYTVDVCSSGEDALKKVGSNLPDLVLLDIILLGMSGIDILQRLKQDHSNLPGVVLSATSQKEICREIEEMEADALVMEPYNQDKLLTLINEILSREENC